MAVLRFGEILREIREAKGLSREALRRRMLKFFDNAPSVSAIRDLENGARLLPHPSTLIKYRKALPVLYEFGLSEFTSVNLRFKLQKLEKKLEKMREELEIKKRKKIEELEKKLEEVNKNLEDNAVKIKAGEKKLKRINNSLDKGLESLNKKLVPLGIAIKKKVVNKKVVLVDVVLNKSNSGRKRNKA